MFHSKVSRVVTIIISIISMFILVSIISVNYIVKNNLCVTSWSEYRYSFLEKIKLEKAAKNGDSEAAYKLGMHYSVWDWNEKKALIWFKKAAEKNHIKAIRRIILYDIAINTPERLKEKEKYIEKIGRASCRERV